MGNNPDIKSVLKWRPKNFFQWLIVNLVLIGLVAIIVLFVLLGMLNIWTHHGANTQVPDVKGMLYNQARQKLESEGFTVELVDSIFDSKAQRGMVVEQNPKEGAVVKEGRTIYLTINAFSDRIVTVPSLTDVSLRQAKSILEGIGINDITVRYVMSEFKDLVVGVKINGVPLRPGMRVPVTSRVVLEVGEGYVADLYSDEESDESAIDGTSSEKVAERPDPSDIFN